MSEARSRRVGGTTQSELMSVVIKGLIVDPNCEFLGAAGGRKKERRFQESDEGEELVAARTKEMSTCRPYIRAKTTSYVYARASLRLRLGNFLKPRAIDLARCTT